METNLSGEWCLSTEPYSCFIVWDELFKHPLHLIIDDRGTWYLKNVYAIAALQVVEDRRSLKKTQLHANVCAIKLFYFTSREKERPIRDCRLRVPHPTPCHQYPKMRLGSSFVVHQRRCFIPVSQVHALVANHRLPSRLGVDKYSNDAVHLLLTKVGWKGTKENNEVRNPTLSGHSHS